MTFGEKFRAERLKLDITQQEIADALGITRRMISRYENDLAHPRTTAAYQKIADFFEVDINYLRTEETAFLSDAAEQYGSRGKQQAQKLLDDMTGLFAGGTLSDNDRDAVMRAMQNIYWETKATNSKKYTPKKHKKKTDDSKD